MEKINACDYLIKVISDWSKFCKTHRVFAVAIAEIVNEKIRLEKENAELKSRLESIGKLL